MRTPDPVPTVRRDAPLLRDPAVWAWFIVALLAIIPATEALSRIRNDARPANVVGHSGDAPPPNRSAG